MDPRLFDVLHDPADVHLLPVRDRVHVDLYVVLHELVNEDGVLGVGTDTGLQVQVQILVVVDDLHPPSAENIGGTYDDRVAKLVRDLPGLVGAAGGPEAGMRDAELGQKPTEARAIFGKVYGIGGGAEYLHAIFLQLAGELQGTLSAELEDQTLRTLAVDNLEYVFGSEGLEVEPRRGVVVSRDSLRVGVDHHGVVASLLEGVARVYAGVVELDALPDAVGAATEHDDRGVLPPLNLVLGLVGGVVVGRPRGKLSGAG